MSATFALVQDVQGTMFPVESDLKSRKSEAAALMLKASQLEGEACDLRMEAMDLDAEARTLRKRSEALSATDRVDGPGLSLLEELLEDGSGFVERVIRRLGKHPLLEPLRAILAKLDALLDEMDGEAERTVKRAIKPIESALHERELRAYGERRAA
jgi:hypothetical protein